MVVGIVPARLIHALLMVTALLVVASLTTQWLARATGHDTMFGLIPEFDLAGENNIPTWFSTILLLSCAVTLAAIAKARREEGDPHSRFWCLLAVVFTLLSLDEAASWHEKLSPLIQRFWRPSGYLTYPWVLPAVVAVGALALALVRFLRALPPQTRLRFLIAGSVYGGGCVGMEMIGGKHISAVGHRDMVYELSVACEEGLEMLGTILFLHALLDYLKEHAGGVTFRLRG